ncbi:MAG: SDR family NAD(P)-dependent oxidoreductase [Planctomycetes bacterium]|nr:SDR family NAD(P)-dependent oxidoreductase [Planctomycetota bacterium]
MNLKRKKILITGADGFIGSHLVERLLDENCQIKAFVYYNSFNSWGWLDTFPKDKLKNIEIFTGDIRDPNGVRTAIKDVDVVFHLAALIGIPFSYHFPDSYIDTNIKGTLNILQACREYNIERVIVTSTSEVYGTAQYIPIDEKHPFQGQSPYSASKIGADKIAESFYRSFSVPVVIARPFNTYGPRQSARAIIPTIITQVLNGNKEIHIGSLHPTRDLNYVNDICNGFVALAKCDIALGKEVNIGSQTEISIENLANLLIELTGSKAKILSEDARKRPETSEVERLVCDSSLLEELTGWRPAVSLKEGLIKTIEWFKDKEILKKYKSDTYNI